MEEMNEVVKELNWKERFVVKVFTKTFNKVYNITRVHIANNILFSK